MARVEPNDLATFLAIARHRSFRKAADEIGVTPSALSHGLRGLEDQLGVRLFNRTTRSVGLTEAGERLRGRVAPAFRDIDDALEDLNTFRDTPTGTLRINAGPDSTELSLLPTVTRFLAAYPGINVEIVVESAFIDIVSGGFDAGVRFGEVLAQDMVAVPLGPPQRSAYVASPEFFRRFPKPETPKDLKTLPCIRFRLASGRVYEWEFERDGARLSVEVEGQLMVGEQALAVRAALDGAGIAFAFESRVEELVAQGRLVRVLEDWCPDYAGYHLYYPSRRHVPAVLRAFIDFIRAQSRPHAATIVESRS
jgi:DNA-binding transcriptional LysR family regulator